MNKVESIVPRYIKENFNTVCYAIKKDVHELYLLTHNTKANLAGTIVAQYKELNSDQVPTDSDINEAEQRYKLELQVAIQTPNNPKEAGFYGTLTFYPKGQLESNKLHVTLSYSSPSPYDETASDEFTVPNPNAIPRKSKIIVSGKNGNTVWGESQKVSNALATTIGNFGWDIFKPLFTGKNFSNFFTGDNSSITETPGHIGPWGIRICVELINQVT